ncbi:MAG: hypothetical protein CSA15_13355, partial [Candidatus Delongbacteria bacterium]
NTYEVTLRAEGTQAQRSSETVLVIDGSSSMGDGSNGTPFYYAKEAAKNIIQDLLVDDNPTGNNKVAIIVFNREIYSGTPQGFYGKNQKTTLINYLNNLDQEWSGTNVSLGLDTAIELLEDDGTSDCSSVENIILLSDGGPTYYGSSGSVNSCNGVPSSPNSCTDAAVASGQDAHMIEVGGGENREVYVYGVMITKWISGAQEQFALQVMDQIQNTGQVYESEDASDLSGIFADIADKIKVIAENVEVKDTLPSNFPIVSNQVTNNGSIISTGNATVSNGSISFPLNNVVKGDDYLYSYRFEVNMDNFCGTQTFSNATIEYKLTPCETNPTIYDFDPVTYCVPCADKSIVSFQQIGNMVEYQGTITEQGSCSGTTVKYKWEFYKDNESTPFDDTPYYNLQNQATYLTGQINMPSSVNDPQTIKAVLMVKIEMAGNGCMES